jgi:hypothetical protein
MAVRYYQDSKTTWKTNPVSGHSWPETTLLNKWVVVGTFGCKSTHKSEEAAAKQAAFVEEFERKYPYTPPKGTRTGK